MGMDSLIGVTVARLHLADMVGFIRAALAETIIPNTSRTLCVGAARHTPNQERDYLKALSNT
jgi:hypothetical protein